MTGGIGTWPDVGVHARIVSLVSWLLQLTAFAQTPVAQGLRDVLPVLSAACVASDSPHDSD